jgi:hypothetical protein
MSDQITLEDAPPTEIDLVRGTGPSIRTTEVYAALQFIIQLAPGRAARITHVTKSFREAHGLSHGEDRKVARRAQLLGF